MDGVESDMEGVLVLCATNLPLSLDTAFLRRLEKRVYIPLPEEEDRKNFLKLHLKKLNNLLNEK